MQKIYIDNSKYLEFIDYIVTEITFQKFRENTYKSSSEIGQKDVFMFQEATQDFYNSKFDEIEYILNKNLNLFSNTID